MLDRHHGNENGGTIDRLGRSVSELMCKGHAFETERAAGRRFHSRLQAEACKGTDSPGTGTCNLREMTGKGKVAVITDYGSRFARASRSQARGLYISKAHAADVIGLESPGPAQCASLPCTDVRLGNYLFDCGLAAIAHMPAG